MSSPDYEMKQRVPFMGIILSALAALMMCACGKEDAKPASKLVGGSLTETQPTFVFDLNGERWHPKTLDGSTPFNVSFDEESGLLRLEAYRQSDEPGNEIDEYFVLQREAPWLGLYYVEKEALVFDDFLNCGRYRPNNVVNDPFLKIGRLDYRDNQIAGDFEFVMINPDCPDTLLITNGYFYSVYSEF